MAIAPENRGGPNGGPQYNPANVSGVGGAGQSGDYSGFAYGMNKSLNEQRTAAPIKPRSVNMPPAEGMQTTPITATTQRSDENIMTGLTPYGQPNDPNALNIPAEPDNAQFNSTMDSYYPVISWIQSRPQTSKETRSVLAMLMRGRGE
jgi:hypothetical protein